MYSVYSKPIFNYIILNNYVHYLIDFMKKYCTYARLESL